MKHDAHVQLKLRVDICFYLYYPRYLAYEEKYWD